MARTRPDSVDRRAHPAFGADPQSALVGPNAVTQLVAALKIADFGDLVVPIFSAAAADDWLAEPPDVMVAETRVARLHRELRAALPPPAATLVMSEAGRLTADYLLRVRIPRLARIALSLLPAALAARLLVRAIRAHAWTFAGSGRFSSRAGMPTTFRLTGNPLCAGEKATSPICAYHAAVFQRLFEVLVSPRTRVAETGCEAFGDACCRFEVTW